MAEPALYVKYIESYVNSSTSRIQQEASLDAIATLLKNDSLTLHALVSEMEMYLTATDSILRSRGILLLGELFTQLTSNPLSDTALQNFIRFFTEKLADWKALRGALVGCLALLSRKANVGMVTISDAKAVAQAYLENLSVQSLGLQDRKLCYQLLECLLDFYPDAVVTLGNDLVLGICATIDGEMDPDCLKLIFHIVEVLPQIFSDHSGPLANHAGELFEILSAYFPIHFTHPTGEDNDVKREELSRALMFAFGSTPLFESHSIPLLLGKLSSSLPSAKIESLKYLSYISLKYGAERMQKHMEALWSALKDAIYTSGPPVSSVDFELMNNNGFQDNEIMTRALELLQVVIQQNDGSFLNLVLGDEDINTFIDSMTQFKDLDNISVQSKQRLYSTGRIFSASAKSSTTSCSKVLEGFFPRLMGALNIFPENQLEVSNPAGAYAHSIRLNFGALYLSVELIAACRLLVVKFDDLSLISDFEDEKWCSMLQNFCRSLTSAFISILDACSMTNSWNAYVHSGVKGLQILAMFPGNFLVVQKPIYESILVKLLSIIISNFSNTLLWKSVLKVLVEIGLFIDEHHEHEKIASYRRIVVEKIVSLISSDDFAMPLLLKLEAVSEIGMAGQSFMPRVVHELDKAISDNLNELYVQGSAKPTELTVKLLECYSYKVIPWFTGNRHSEEVPLKFAVSIWDKFENSRVFSLDFQEDELLGATMEAMKQAVASCSQESQELVIHMAYRVLLTSTFFASLASASGSSPSMLEGFGSCHHLDRFSCRDEWLISLFASVVIALHPQTLIPNIRTVLKFFITTLLRGYVPSAQALGSLVNKLPLNISGTDLSEKCSLEEAVEMVFDSTIRSSWHYSCKTKCSGVGSVREMDFCRLSLNGLSCVSVQIHAIIGLAWIGKGLLMRGHEKIKDICMAFLSCLFSTGDTGILSELQNPVEEGKEPNMFHLMKSAADAFHILMSDSEACLNRRYHAIIRPLYKQRFFNTMMPILLSALQKSDSTTRILLHRAFGHLVSGTPLTALLSVINKLIPMVLDCLLILSKDIVDKQILHDVLLVLSGMLMDRNGKEAILENAHIIIGQLIGLTSYPHMMVIRETAIQCLAAISELPHARIYPLRTQVLQAMLKALDDPRRAVRQEAVKCRQAWASIASRSLHF